MSGLEDRLQIDISEALAAAARVDAAFAAIGDTFQRAIQDALTTVQGIDATVTVQADTDAVTPAVDDALAAANDVVPVEADTAGLTDSVDAAIGQADTTVNVDADIAAAQAAIESLNGEDVTIGVTADTGQAEEALSGVTEAAHSAGEGAHASAGEFGILGLAAKGAAGEIGAGTEALHLFGAGGVAAAGAIGAVAVVTKDLFSNAVSARSAQERFNLILGESAEVVEKIDIGGLNTDLEHLAVSLGSTGKDLENAASKIFGLGVNSGIAAPQVAETTKEVIALASRAVALNPQLGNVGDAAQRLFTGLARGGRFAANFNLALTSAEITARALADTGKATAADLTIYEKAAAGAALATEKLGGSLGKDIEEGSKNVAFSISSLKAEFESFLEAAGQPLIDPLIESLQHLLPVAVSLAGAFGEVLPPLVDVANEILEGVAPAFDLLGPVITVVVDALKVAAVVLNAIPGPVKDAAIAFTLLSVALGRVAASGLVSSAAGFSQLSGSVAALNAAVIPVTAGIVGVSAVVNKAKGEISRADDETQKYTDSLINMLNTAPDIESFQAGLGKVADEANRWGDAANKANSNPLRAFDGHDTRLANDAAVATRSVFDAGQEVVGLAKDLQHEYGLTSQAALQLARSGDEQVAAFKRQADATKDLTDTQKEAERASNDFWLAAQTGALTAVDIQNQAAAVGATFDDMATAVDKAREPIVKFATDVESALPGATKALQDLGDNNSLDKFIGNLEKNVADSAAFVGNLQTLIERGATDLAKLLEQTAVQDPGKAAAFAAQAVKEGQAALDATEAKVDATNFGRTLVNKATQSVTDQLSGGLELAFNKAQEAIGAQMLKIPGQVEPQAKESGRDIATNLIAEILLPFQHLSADMEKAGEDAITGFETGVSKGDPASAAGAKAKAIIDNVKHVLGIQSPSKVFEEIGRLVNQGFFIGLADIQGATEAVNPLLDVVKKFGLSAGDIAKASGDSVDELTKSLTKMGEAEKNLSADQLKEVGKAVEALGGEKGVKALQTNLAQQVAAAFKGLDAKSITDVVSALNTKAALERVTAISGVTPKVPDPFTTQVVKGADSTTFAGPTIGQQIVNVTPPPDASPSEIAGEVAVAAAWAFRGVAP